MKEEVKVSYDWLSDKEWLDELDDREAESLRDDVKTFSLDEAIEMARQHLQNKKSLAPGHQTSL
jgi:hypothetical protein